MSSSSKSACPYHLYVLKLQNRRWYVGTTSKKVETRFQEHQSGDGSVWTRKYPPLRIDDFRPVSTMENHLALETKETYIRMMVYGVNNVRGGPRTQGEDFTEAQLEDLVREIGHTLDLDFDYVRKKLEIPPRSTLPRAMQLVEKSQTVSAVAKPAGKSQPVATPIVGVSAALLSAILEAHSSSAGQTKSATKSKRPKSSIVPFSVCAYCDTDKPIDEEKPLCGDCWRSIDNFSKCACCNTKKIDDPDRPLCLKCFRAWRSVKGAAKVT